MMGAGRSGTTIADIILGNQRGFFSCGELNRFPVRQGVPPLIKGKRKLFWDKFKNKFLSVLTEKEGSEIRFKSNKHKEYAVVCNKFEYHIGYLKSLFYKNKKEYAIYKRYIYNFFNTLFSMIHAETIIDSSKYPGRLYQLVRLGFRVKVIYLIREPSMVVQSFEKKNLEQPSKHWLIATIYYFVVNLLCSLTLLLLKKKIEFVKVKYEDLINNPVDVLKKIELSLELNLEHLITKIEAEQMLIVGHLFDGNRIRVKNKINIIQKNNKLSSRMRYMFARFLNNLFYS